MFGGPANIAFDRNGYAWVANNVFQGTPNSGDFLVVLQPDGQPSTGTNGAPPSVVTGAFLMGPGWGIDIDSRGYVWAGSFGWGPSEYIPTQGITSQFDPSGRAIAGYIAGADRVQACIADSHDNIWLASYGNNAVVVYPGGRADAAISYVPDNSSPLTNATGTFGIAINPDGTAWVTYSGGLGWPIVKTNPGYVARFRIADGALKLMWSQQVGLANKAVAADSRGNAWVASGGDSHVYSITPEGKVSGFTGCGGMDSPWGIAVDGNDDVWVANFGALGITKVYENPAITKLAGVASPSGCKAGEPLTPKSGYTLPTGGDPVTLPDGSPLYDDERQPCKSPLMRMTSVAIDQAGNVWAVNNWKPRFGTDFPPRHGNPGGDGIVIFVGLAKPPEAGR